MALCHLSSLSCSLHKPHTFVFFPKIPPFLPKLKSHQNPPRKNLQLACSAEKTSKKGRQSRARKNNEDLCNELREFMVTMGIVEDRVPTTKELLEHGRKDLANIVRRRGYKVILELLKHSSEKDTSTEKKSLGNQDTSNACRDKSQFHNFVEDQERNFDKSAGYFSISDSSLEESCMVRANGSISTNSIWTCEPSEPSIGSLQLKETNFIHTRALDRAEDATEVERRDMPTGSEVNSNILNSNVADTASVDSRQISSRSMDEQSDRDDTASSEEIDSDDFDMDLASEAAEKDNQIEIDRLKAMLDQKEIELSQLKQQIEKEKQVLLHSQAKANVEIGNVRRIISSKDMELHSTEESLLGLKEVQIEYRVNGESVEVAGSFNGWHHRVKMDLHPSSNTRNSPGSRISELWSTELWLYPGMYEIKFIVDGQWQTDSQRELITSGSITNNILRVDR